MLHSGNYLYIYFLLCSYVWCTVWHFVGTILRLVFTVESGLALNILNSIFDSAMFGTTLRNTFITAALSIVLGFSSSDCACNDYKPNSPAEMEENCSDNGLYSILYFNGCYKIFRRKPRGLPPGMKPRNIFLNL